MLPITLPLNLEDEIARGIYRQIAVQPQPGQKLQWFRISKVATPKKSKSLESALHQLILMAPFNKRMGECELKVPGELIKNPTDQPTTGPGPSVCSLSTVSSARAAVSPQMAGSPTLMRGGSKVTKHLKREPERRCQRCYPGMAGVAVQVLGNM